MKRWQRILLSPVAMLMIAPLLVVTVLCLPFWRFIFGEEEER